MTDTQPEPGQLRTRLLVTVICVAASIVSVVPFFLVNRPATANEGSLLWMPLTNDMILQLDQMKSFYRGISSGVIYPRWEEDTNRGFGAPTTSYYPPGVYYLTSVIFALTGDWIWTLLFAHLVLAIAAGFAFYWYARRHLERTAAIAAMIAYTFMPYHVLDQYQRGAIAELLAFVFMPLMLGFGERLLLSRIGTGSDAQKPASKTSAGNVTLNLAGFALSLGGFLWCHPATAYQFLMAFAIFAVSLVAIYRTWRNLVYVGIGLAWGMSLSAAYLYPASIEQDLIHHEFVSKAWPYHGSYILARSTGYDLIDFSWIFCIVSIAIAGFVLLALEHQYVEPTKGLRERIWVWVIVGCFASFMMTTLSLPVEKLIPKIDFGVFSWRMLSITTLIAALLGGASVQAAKNARRMRRDTKENSFASIVSVIIIGGAIFLAVRVIAPTFTAPPFETAEEHVNLVMMPAAGPIEALELPKVEPAELAGGHGRVEVRTWNPQHRVIAAQLESDDKLLIRTFNFPGWRATVDGEPATISSGDAIRVALDNGEQVLLRADTFKATDSRDGEIAKVLGREPLGDIVIDLKAGAHEITLDFVNTPPRRLGVLVTLSSFALVVVAMPAGWVIRRRGKRLEEPIESNLRAPAAI